MTPQLERSIERHRARGKLLARERVELLADPGTAILELSPQAAHGCYDGEVPGAGVVCAIVLVAGRHCMVIANDATIKGGTYYPLGTRKHLRAQEIAYENRLPCISLVDSGGAHLPLQAELFADREHGGRIFYNEAVASAAEIPQLAAVMGSCTAGGAYIPAMSDETVIVEKTGTVFLAGPPLVQAATGEVVSAEELGGAWVHTQRSGLADHFAHTDQEAIEILRRAVEHLPTPPVSRSWQRRDPTGATAAMPATAEAARAAIESAGGASAVLDAVVDAPGLQSFKARYGTALTCGFAHVAGYPVAVVAGTGSSPDAAALRKAAHLAGLADRRGVPIISLQHETGGGDPDGATLRAAATLAAVMATVRVPRIVLQVGDARGPLAWPLGTRALAPRFLLRWPLGTTGEALDALEATAQVYDDGIVQPADTRDVLALLLAVVANHPLEAMDAGAPTPPPDHFADDPFALPDEPAGHPNPADRRAPVLRM